MKKSFVAALTVVIASAIVVTGCQGSSKIETDKLTISQYKGVEVDKAEKTEVTDEDVDNMIQSTLQTQATEKEITDRAVKEGDITTINFVGKMDGVEFEGGSGEDYPLTIGSGQFIEGFEESIIGHKKGDTFDWNGKFPEDYTDTDKAGKDVVFTITVNKIAEQEVPKLNDKFVKSVSEESKTVKEYKKEVKEKLESDAETTYNDTLGSSVWQKVLENTKVKEYPTKKVKELSDSLVEQYKTAAQYYGMEYDKFITEQMGGTVEDFEKQVKDAAKSSVKQSMATEAIAEKANIKLTDDEYKEQLKTMAKAYGYENVKALKEAAEEKDLKEMALSNLVKDYLVDNCVQVKAKSTEGEETK